MTTTEAALSIAVVLATLLLVAIVVALLAQDERERTERRHAYMRQVADDAFPPSSIEGL